MLCPWQGNGKLSPPIMTPHSSDSITSPLFSFQSSLQDEEQFFLRGSVYGSRGMVVEQ